MSFPFKPTLLALLVCQIVPAWAENEVNDVAQTQHLEDVIVVGTPTKVRQKLGEERVRRKQLDKQQVNDEYDLVRYDTGITVVEGGRAGSNGFAIRGVDKDRVAINVDGLAQAESRSSEAFQELFGAYGNYNANRNTSEIENFSEVVLTKGADSLKSGSGALGGAVNYKTKSPEDYVSPEKPYHIGVKGGYIGRNSQKFSSLTVAGRLKNLDGLLVYTKRHGKETSNRSEEQDTAVTFNEYVFGPLTLWRDYYKDEYKSTGVLRSKPDPQSWWSKSVLMKAGYHITPNNYIATLYEDSRTDKTTNELSNLWVGTTYSTATGDFRIRQDASYRRRTGFEYRNILERGPWDLLKVHWNNQLIDMKTWTYDVPKNLEEQGINGDVYHLYRNIRQRTKQWGVDAEKEQRFNGWTWASQYGIGGKQGENTNDDHSYHVRLYNPNIKTSAAHAQTILIESQSKSRHAYWSNVFRFGSNEQYRLSAGVRYDHNESSAKDNPLYPRNIRAQIPHLGEKRKHSGVSYGFGFDWNITPNWSLLSKVGTGFRAPTADETWLLFPHPDFYLKANPNLKAETARNMEIGVAAKGSAGNFRLSAFRTNYRNFIELSYMGGSGPGANQPKAYLANDEALVGAPVWQNQNRSSAYVQGVEFSGRWKLDSIGLPKGLYSGLTASYLKGKSEQTDGRKYPINALSPWSAVWSLGYDAPSEKWGAVLHVSHTAAKKPSDTVHSNDDLNNPWPYAKHSKPYTLLDVSAYVNLGKHFTLRGGVYNLTNKKYYTWDALRSVREFGTVNRVDRATHAGIERFTSPGRNVNFTLEATF